MLYFLLFQCLIVEKYCISEHVHTKIYQIFVAGELNLQGKSGEYSPNTNIIDNVDVKQQVAAFICS